MVWAFKERRERTFKVSEEVNHAKEREVETWIRQRGNQLRSRGEIRIVDTPDITADLVGDIMKSSKERAPGPSRLTRTMLLHTSRNIHRIYGEIFTSCLAAGYFHKQFKRAK